MKVDTAQTISLSKDLFYPAGWSCLVTIQVPANHVIWLTFQTFDVGRPTIVYCTDVLRIYDGKILKKQN